MYFVSLAICALLVSACACAKAANTDTTLNLDGNDQGRVFDGIGGLSAGANSRLLYDYPEPQRSQVLDYLFKPNFGASLQVLKVEIGGTMNSTWGSEASHANTRDEFEHPKPEYYERGYEWWLMKEAKKRNPDIILEGLQWGAPGWIGGGNFFSQDNADFVAQFIKGARDYHGLTMNYQGIRNETGYDVGYIKTLRKTLDKNGLQDVKIVATDSVGAGAWDTVIRDISADPEAIKAVYALGIHYAGNTTTDAARNLGKPLWASEESMCADRWARADGLSRIYNMNYVLGRMTKTIICALITSNPDNLDFFGVEAYADPGLMRANAPWTGYYEVRPAIWATAHTTQFTKLGWRYLDCGCGELKDGGSYVTLRSSDKSGDYSIIIETMKGRNEYGNMLSRKDSDPLPDVPVQQMKFNVKNLSDGVVHVWRSNKTEQFVQLSDIKPENGSFTITLEGNSIYTLTTTTGQHKGSHANMPKASPFPFPCKDDFEKYAPGQMARYFADQEGTFLTADRSDGRGKCLRQVVPQRGIMWVINQLYPWTIIGAGDWKDYEVSVDVHIEKQGFVGVYGRIDGSCTRQMPGGYGLTIDQAGGWQLRDTTGVLESGSIVAEPNSWHNLKLRFKGFHVIGAIDGKTVCHIVDDAHPNGSVGLISSYDCVEFDNFIAKPYKGRSPGPIAGWENLALNAKATASSQLDDKSGPEKAVDGDHQTGWCPAAGKTSGEWLELDFGKELTFDSTVIDQYRIDWNTGAVSGYKIQYWNGRDWKNLVIGKSMSSRQRDDFSPVTAQRLRLLITASAEKSYVHELGVYRRKR